MKQIAKFFVLAILMIAFSASTFAQATATATASATIVTPIAISNTTNLSFGDIAVDAVGGTVTVTPALAATRSAGSVNINLVTGATPVTAADFTVTGLIGSTYTITLPADGVVVLTGAGTDMPVDVFTSSIAVGAGDRG